MENKDWTGYIRIDFDTKDVSLAGHVTGTATHPDRPEITLLTVFVKAYRADMHSCLFVLWTGADWARHTKRGDFIAVKGVYTSVTSHECYPLYSVTSVERTDGGYENNQSIIAAALEAEKRAADRAYRIRVATEELAGL